MSTLFFQGLENDHYFDCSVFELFSRIADKKAKKVALVELDHAGVANVSITYKELADKINSFSASLCQKGVVAGDRIIIHGVCSIAFLISFLSILKLGACCVPVEAQFPLEYKKRLINASKAFFLINLIKNFELKGLKQINFHEVNLDNITSVAPTHSMLSESSPSLLMFTSGSTGNPKGILHNQFQLLNRLHWMWREYPVKRGDIFAARSSVSVMPSMWELFGGLLKGHKSILIAGKQANDPAMLLCIIKRFGIRYMTIPTVLLSSIIERGESCHALRMIITGGTFLKLSVVALFKAIIPNAVVVDDYGLTECNTVLHRAYLPDKKYQHHPAFQPVDNCCVFIKNRDNENHGRLMISGYPVMLSYTDERLNNDSFYKDKHGVRYFITTDLARFDDNSKELLLLGRCDNTIKISGYTLQLENIETIILQQIQGIEAVLLTVIKNVFDENLLCALLVSNAPLSVSEFVTRFHQHLPDYMIPTKILMVDTLPQRPNVKVDRQKAAQLFKKTDFQTCSSLSHTSEKIANILGKILMIPEEKINYHQSFSLLGLNSLLTLKFINLLSEKFKKTINVSDIYNYHTVALLTDFFNNTVDHQTVNQITSNAIDCIEDAIVIVGYDACFGNADNLNALWQNINNDSFSETISSDSARKSWQQLFKQKKKAYLCRSAEYFDNTFFKISDHEALHMDPQMRLLLEKVWSAIESSGHSPDEYHGKNVGVFVGAQQSDYSLLFDSATTHKNNALLLGNDLSFLASRIAYHFDFKAPALTFDTACSSSFSALYHAYQSLKRGSIELAIVAGVSIKPSINFYFDSESLGILTQKGYCSPFSDDADGFVIGEGIGVVVLKRIMDAHKQKDTIYAKLKNIELFHEGRTNGITAPSTHSQIQLLKACYERVGLNIQALNYYETHGTGTYLGDPIEYAAMQAVFKQTRSDNKHKKCPIGSVKAVLGHTTAAAGMASLIKVLLSFEHGRFPKLAHFDRLNAQIAKEDDFFFFPRSPIAFSRQNKQLVGISSFGMSGLISHAILESYPNRFLRKTHQHKENVTFPILITTHYRSSVAAFIKEWLTWLDNLEKHVVPSYIQDISFTSICGRSWFKYRVLFFAQSISDLKQQLSTFKESDIIEYQLNDRTKLKRFMPLTLSESSGAIKEWVHGSSFCDFSFLYASLDVKRVKIPGYKFIKRHCWPEEDNHVVYKNRVTNEVHDDLLLIARKIFDQNTLKMTSSIEEAGFDSLSLLSFKVEIEKQFGVNLPLSFFHPDISIHTIKQAIEEVKNVKSDTDDTVIDINNLTDVEVESFYTKLSERGLL